MPAVSPRAAHCLRSQAMENRLNKLVAPRSTYSEFCSLAKQPKPLDLTQYTSTSNPKEDAAALAAMLKKNREGHDVFIADPKEKDQKELDRLRAQIEIERSTRHELQSELKARQAYAARAEKRQVAASATIRGDGSAMSPR